MNKSSVLAQVNDFEIPCTWQEQVVRNNLLQNLPDTEDNRVAIKNELVAREVLSQKALELGLETSEAFLSQMALFRQMTLAEMAVQDHFKKNPITEEDVQKDYERQVGLLKEASEYRVSSIVVLSQEEALAALQRLNAGEAFAVVAQDVSIESSKAMGGDLGWLLPHQIIPLVANVVVNLQPGALVTAPIQSEWGWHLVRLEAIRPYVIPPLAVARDRVREGLAQQQRAIYIQQRIAQARIVD